MNIPTTLTPDMNRRAGRMLAGGRLTATVTSKRTGDHITVSIKCCINKPDAPYGQRWPTVPPSEATHIFIEAGAHDRVGTLYPQSQRYYRNRTVDPAREYAAAMVLRYACGEDFESEITETDQCGVCGRKLTDPVSIERGIGSECFGRQTDATHQHRGEPAQTRIPLDGMEEYDRLMQARENLESCEVAIQKIERNGGDASTLVGHLAELRELAQI